MRVAARSALPPTLYLGIDGTGVPMRAEELVGRPGKQPDGSAKTREVKLCTVWSAASRDARAAPSATRARSATRPPSKAPPPATPPPSSPPSGTASNARPAAGASTAPLTASSSATAHRGSGTSPRSYSPAPSRSSISSMPRSTSARSPRPSMDPTPTSPGSGRSSARPNLEAGDLDALLAALHAHAATHDEARQAPATSNTTATACATPTSETRRCASPPAWSRPAARWRSPPASSAPACPGPSPMPMPSSPCAAAGSAAASRTSAHTPPPQGLPSNHAHLTKSVVHPARDGVTRPIGCARGRMLARLPQHWPGRSLPYFLPRGSQKRSSRHVSECDGGRPPRISSSS